MLSNTRRIFAPCGFDVCSAGCLGRKQAKETAIIVLQDGAPDRTGEVYEVSTLQLVRVCFGTQNIPNENLHALQILTR